MKQTTQSTMNEASAEFVAWWEPIGKDHESGADAGGHPEAERVWARKDPGRWVHRTYGIPARIAWNTSVSREQYLAWVEVGRPEGEPFVGIAAPIEKQKQFLASLKPLIGGIGSEERAKKEGMPQIRSPRIEEEAELLT